jgi:hypothetical protein
MTQKRPLVRLALARCHIALSSQNESTGSAESLTAIENKNLCREGHRAEVSEGFEDWTLDEIRPHDT